MRIGVFDSGIGGEAIAQTIQHAFPHAETIVINDKANVPYGDKSNTDILRLTYAAIQPLLDAHCDIIIIACNTATAVAIEQLRHDYPAQKFIGLEPMIKTAVEQTRSKIIAVCATPATLANLRYKKLKHRFADNVTCLELDCGQWAAMIENNTINQEMVETAIESAIHEGADVIVLACTHYHWIRQLIEHAAKGRAAVIDPSEAIVKRVNQLMAVL